MVRRFEAMALRADRAAVFEAAILGIGIQNEMIVFDAKAQVFRAAHSGRQTIDRPRSFAALSGAFKRLLPGFCGEFLTHDPLPSRPSEAIPFRVLRQAGDALRLEAVQDRFSSS